ncbi:MAG: type II secretion system F family protein, partial [Frankiales bacterium]
MIALAALTAAATVLVLLSTGDRGRLGRALPAPATSARPSGTARIDPGVAVCALTGVVVALLLPLPVGPVLGAALAAAGPRVIRRLEPRAERRQREQLTADLPLALDLLASCLAGGAPLPAAARAVAAALPGPAGGRLAGVAAALDVGSPPAEAWSLLGGGAAPDDPLGPAARALARAAEGGAPVARAV